MRTSSTNTAGRYPADANQGGIPSSFQICFRLLMVSGLFWLVTSTVPFAVAQSPVPRTADAAATTEPAVVEVVEVKSVGPTKASLLDTRRDIVAFTQRLRNSTAPVERIAAIVDLCSMYFRVVSDPRFPAAEPMQGYRARIAARLQQESKQLKREMKNESAGESGAGRSSASATASWTTGQNDSRDLVTGIVDAHWQLVTRYAGGTGPVNYYSSGYHGSSGYFLRNLYAGQMFDHGPELVALIEAILHPDYWQVAGGEGTIHYYQPLRILVIRARTTVHEDIENFLERLR